MAERLILHYLPGDSFFHRWDARGKLLCMLLASAAIMQNRVVVFTGFSILLPVAMGFAGISITRLRRELRAWFVFFLIIIGVYALTAPGSGWQPVSWLPLSVPGMLQGIWISWRLLLLLTCAVLFSSVTRPRELRDAVLWLLSPLPFLPRYRIAFMAGLTMRFVPLVLDELDEIREASKARLGDRRKNPWRRTKYVVLPLFRRVFLRSDDLAMALAARCYREDLPEQLSRLPLPHLIPAALLVVLWVSGFLR
jgi:energy-coupling factor transporter transmembrane protein EcfT